MKGGCLKIGVDAIIFSFVFFFESVTLVNIFKIGRLLIDLPQKNNNITTTAVFHMPTQLYSLF